MAARRAGFTSNFDAALDAAFAAVTLPEESIVAWTSITVSPLTSDFASDGNLGCTALTASGGVMGPAVSLEDILEIGAASAGISGTGPASSNLAGRFVPRRGAGRVSREPAGEGRAGLRAEDPGWGGGESHDLGAVAAAALPFVQSLTGIIGPACAA